MGEMTEDTFAEFSGSEPDAYCSNTFTLYFTDKEGEDVFSRNLFKSINANICEPFEMDELDNLNKMADCFILGSDQVFTSSSISAFGKLFLMEFAKDEKRKIAVSA